MNFGMAYLAIVIAIAARWRSRAAFYALPPLIATVAIVWLSVPNASAYYSAAWALSGALLMYQSLRRAGIPRNGELLAGVLYGISGLVYVAYYLGAEHATFALIPVISDLCFGIGLFTGTWPNFIVNIFSRNRRNVRRTAVQIARADLESNPMLDRGRG